MWPNGRNGKYKMRIAAASLDCFDRHRTHMRWVRADVHEVWPAYEGVRWRAQPTGVFACAGFRATRCAIASECVAAQTPRSLSSAVSLRGASASASKANMPAARAAARSSRWNTTSLRASRSASLKRCQGVEREKVGEYGGGFDGGGVTRKVSRMRAFWRIGRTSRAALRALCRSGACRVGFGGDGAVAKRTRFAPASSFSDGCCNSKLASSCSPYKQPLLAGMGGHRTRRAV